MTQTKRVLVLPDIHYPVEDRQTMKIVLEYAADHKWDQVVQLGDLMDFDMISSHNAGNLRAVEGRRIKEDYAYAAGKLNELQTAIQHAPLTILEGNHDYRIERYIDAHPETKGMLEVAAVLKFKERKINWVRNWSKGKVYTIGNATFIHGHYTNEFHAKSHALAYGTNVFYGHMHSMQSYPRHLKGKDKLYIAHSLGCLCRLDLAYMRGRPSNWCQSFTVFHFFPGGNFVYFPVPIINHRFVSPEGKVYGE